MSNTIIKSDTILVERPISQVYEFLSNLNNYKSLMPPEVVSFDVNNDVAALNLKGLGAFNIHLGEGIPNQMIHLKPEGKLPFDFDIQWNLTDVGNKTEIVGQINAKLNMFMKMMAEQKLSNFVSSQAFKMKNHIETGIPLT